MMIFQHFRRIASRWFALAAVLMPAAGAEAAPQIGVVAEVGESAGTDRNWALVQLKFMDGAEPHPAYRIYWKPGAADSPSPYGLLAAVAPTADVPTIDIILDRAAQAGIDLVALEIGMNDILGAFGPAGTLAEKLSFFVQAESDTGLIEAQRESLAANQPVVAAVLGRACFASVPSDGPSTFEVRAFEPVGGVEGPVIGRATIGDAPGILPAPDGLAEKVEESARGHLRVGLKWCFPEPLRKRFLHWKGFRVFRANRQEWFDEFGADPPVNIDRATLLAALETGNLVQVNRLPIQPAEAPECPLPAAFDTALFTDDNDSEDGLRLVTGGAPFEAGDEFMYWVAASDLFDRVGHPSPGHLVTICDRLPPSPPSGLTAVHRHRYDDATQTSLTFARLEWDREPATEVRRWYLYCVPDHDDALADMAADPDNPITPNLLAVIDNVGEGARVAFDHDDAAALPLPDPGVGVYYYLRAEDNSPCLDAAGRGNLSGPCGPVPFALHDLAPPGRLSPRPAVTCCEIAVETTAAPGDPARPFTAILRAKRPSGRFLWVEFRETIANRYLGRFEFPETANPTGAGANEIVFEDTKGAQGPVRYAVRYGAVGGIVSDWIEEGAADTLPFGIHVFSPSWNCRPLALPTDCPGDHPPLDPETGDPNPFCIAFNSGNSFESYIVYRRVGIGGPLVKIGSGLLGPNEDVVFCDSAFPPGGGELCYFLQGFGANWGPGPLEAAGCITVAPLDGLPRPEITATAAAQLIDPGAAAGEHDIEWFCPRTPERFEVAFTPAPANAESHALEFLPGGAIREWGILETARTATEFGDAAPRFGARFALVQGVGYKVKVRAIRGVGDHRDFGPWSEIRDIQWMETGVPVGEVPWPVRDVPGITGPLVGDWDETESIGRVAIGLAPVTAFGQNIPLPADLPEAFLFVEPPFTAYLHEASPTGRGTMLQVTHQMREILHQQVAGGILVNDLAIQIAPEPALFGDSFPRLWLRIDQPLIAGRSYVVTLVKHHADGEIEQVLQSNEIEVPAGAAGP